MWRLQRPVDGGGLSVLDGEGWQIRPVRYRTAEEPAIGAVLLGVPPQLTGPAGPVCTIQPAAPGDPEHTAYRAIRHAVFVEEHGLFSGHDLDDIDEDPRTVVLVARTAAGEVLGGVRLGPVDPLGEDIGWWAGSRLAVAPRARRLAAMPRTTGMSASSGAALVNGLGPALVRAACAHAEAAGVLRFDATVRAGAAPLFTRLGWERVDDVQLRGAPHIRFRWPIRRVRDLVAATKAPLGDLLGELAPGGHGFVGDDGAPVPGTDAVVACDAILPSLVERDPEWAGWCAVLVNVNDLAAMGADPVGLLDAVGARDASFAARVLTGLRRASEAFGVPVLGGHTTLGVPASLAVTALGRTASPVPAGGGRPGHRITLTADLGGGWRAGHTGRQWDSTSARTPSELASMTSFVRRLGPAAAKDVSMAGVVGTLGMLAEASGCGAVLDVAAVPRPGEATMGDWLTCFPGFAMITADGPERSPGDPAARPGGLVDAGPAVSRVCGDLVPGHGVRLRWPDGVETEVLDGGVTGMGVA